MIDFKVDLTTIREAKKRKTDMLARLKQIDFDNSGLISPESFLQIAEKYGLTLNASEMQEIKGVQKKNSQVQKIDYIKVLNDIKMKLDPNGDIKWIYGAGNEFLKNYRIKIEEISNFSYSESTDHPQSRKSKSLSKTRNASGIMAKLRSRDQRKFELSTVEGSDTLEILMQRPIMD